MVMAQSLFTSLQLQKPQSLIDVIAPAWSVDLIGRMPEVRKAYTLDVAHGELGLAKRWRTAQTLRQNRYQRAIVLPRSFKSALVPFWARIPVRTGFKTEMRYGLLNDLRELDPRLNQTVKRFVALGMEREHDPATLVCPQPRLQTSDDNAQKLLVELNLSSDKPVVGLMPGAEYGPAKQWPTEYFRKLAGQLVQHGYAIWIFGSQKEAELGRLIASVSPQSINNLCGRTSLVDAVDLIAQLNVAVSNDSGLMHIAAAVDVPLIAIYGSSSPTYTPPLSKKAVIEYLGLECSPCYKRQCPFGHYACLKDLSVDRIAGDIEKLKDFSVDV
ncbi:MAG: lipopolysaccharide heptosyltransferase II [Gammaproteobacteria bacterium]|nr:lipopolysaccharide heptosyltransferase II [Gammaproteobacteria bacterium]